MRLALALLLGSLLLGCSSGGERETSTGGDSSGIADGNTGGESGSDSSGTTGGGQSGPIYVLNAFQQNFDVIEGTEVNVPVIIQRLNGHQRSVGLSARTQSSDPEGRLSYSFSAPQIGSGTAQVNLTVRYLPGKRPSASIRHQIAVSANDGVTQSETLLTINIQPSDRPDIYLLIGQSNMVGFSESGARDISAGGPDERDPRIQQLNVTANDANSTNATFRGVDDFADPARQIAFPDFVQAEDPLHISRDPNMADKGDADDLRVGLGLSFAKRALAKDPSRNIILVPAAWSSTGFCNTGGYLGLDPRAPDWVAEGELGWNPFPLSDPVFGGTTLFTRAVLRANLAIEKSGGILRGILWHQGESDGDNPVCAANYANNLRVMVRELREQIVVDARGPAARGATSDVPFIVGTMSRGSDTDSDYSLYSDDKQLVDDILRNPAEMAGIPYSGAAAFDDLIPSNGFPCGEGDCVHYGAASYREMGVRYFDVFDAVLDQP